MVFKWCRLSLQQNNNWTDRKPNIWLEILGKLYSVSHKNTLADVYYDLSVCKQQTSAPISRRAEQVVLKIQSDKYQ